MKTNPVKRCNNALGMTFYSYKCICDNCGKEVISGPFETTQYPDFNELDLCVDCLRELLDKKYARYDDLKEKLFKPYNPGEIKEVNYIIPPISLDQAEN